MGWRNIRLNSLAAVAAACLLIAGAADANPRIHVEAMEYPWSTVGRLNIAGKRYCSAVLISERHILTAAHCLWNPVTREWWPAASVHFIAGYQGGEAALATIARYYVVADGWVPGRLEEDWAVVELEDPVGQSAGWVPMGKPEPGAPLGQLGYRAGPLFAFLPEGPRLIGITTVFGHALGKISTGSVAITGLFDQKRYPNAAKLLAGLNRSPGHHPPDGGAVATRPAATVAALDGGQGTPPTLANLAKLLGRVRSGDSPPDSQPKPPPQ